MTSATDARELDRTKLAAARLRAVEAQPFLAVALYALIPVSDPATPTFAVDEQWHLLVNPDRLAEWNVAEVATVLLHEVGHVVRDHAGRARAAGVDRATAFEWNLAGDAEINDDLEADGHPFPIAAVFPRSLRQPAGRAAEFYFWRLCDGLPRALPHVDCGSGAHGLDPQGVRAIGALPPGIDPVDQLLIRRRVAEAILAHRVGVQAGQGGGGWTRWAEALLHPVVDWRRHLRASIRSGVGAVSGAVDYSYGRPSRRRVEGVVLPSLRRPLPRAAVVVDTSASVDDTQLAAAWTEVHGVLRSLGVRRDLLTVWSTDVLATKLAGPIGSRVGLVGGGGTDMGAGIAAAMGQRPRPGIVVVLTDGETPWPRYAPAAKVVVGLLETGRTPPPPPRWADVVTIPISR